jgi:hypothetical protein
MGWSFPWASSFGSDFNFDFDTSVTEEQQRSGRVEYNFRTQDVGPSLEAGKEGPLAEFAAGAGTDWATFTREQPGMSPFALDGGVVYHTYWAYARGVDGSGACTSGSTGPREGGTRPDSGFAATTSTTRAERGRPRYRCQGEHRASHRRIRPRKAPDQWPGASSSTLP